MKLPGAFQSLRWRVQMLYGALLAGVLTVLGVAVFFVLLDRFMRDVDNKIYAAGFAVYRQLQGKPHLPAASHHPAFAEPAARGMYVVVWDQPGLPSWQSTDAPSGVPEPSGTGDGFRTRDWKLREYYAPVSPTQWVLVGRSLLPEYRRWTLVILGIAGGGLLLWAAALTAGWFLVGRALRPIDRIAETAEHIAAGDLTQRIVIPDQRSELGRLAAVLNASFERLEALFARQRRFTADAAHELRTPTAIILAHAHNGRQSPGLSAEDRAAFEASERAALRMTRLIEGLLQLARSDAGHRPVVEPFDLTRVVDEAIDTLRESATHKGIELPTDLAPVSVVGDPHQLSQVVTNLVENAIYYHDKSPGFVRVTLRTEGTDAIVEVADNGPGIAPEHLPHLFERFYRVDPVRSGRDGRTGLGLAISEEILKAHGGKLTVRSEIGKGSVFCFNLRAEFRGFKRTPAPRPTVSESSNP